MSTLAFMPWCRIDKAYQLGDIEIIPFERHKPIDGLDDAATSSANTIMAAYKDIEGKPVDKAAIIRCLGRSPIDYLSEEEVDTVYELAALACFCGLANREYFNSIGHYCNSDCFTLYVQKFKDADIIALTIRRREGQTLSAWGMDEIAISIPTHCHTINSVSLDESLVGALVSYRAQLNSKDWGRWQNAISCFNQANTDSNNVRYQMECVLLCSAFEHLLHAESKVDVASKLAENMAPEDSLLATKATRRLDDWPDNGNPLRYQWMVEFYNIRNKFAHGKLKTQRTTAWNPSEHLFLASIAFPLLVKSLLAKAGKYTLTAGDRSQINCFEKFADTKDFLQGSRDSYWQRIIAEEESVSIRKAAVQAIEKMRAEKATPEATGAFSTGEQGNESPVH